MPDSGPDEVLLRLLASPNVASKESVYRQYDHQVMTNTVVPPGGDAALLRIKGTRKAIALSTDGNGRYCYLDPYAGGAIAVVGSGQERVVCRGTGDSGDRLPELREPGEAGGVLSAGAVHQRYD